MLFSPLRTRPLVPPQDDLLSVIRDSLVSLPERSILAVTSKVVSIWEGRCVKHEAGVSKRALAEEEADLYILPEDMPCGRRFQTITQGILIGSAGIDASNGNGYLTLWPKDPYASAEKLRAWLSATYDVSSVGVVITDSHTMPLRRGAVGIALAYAGFAPLRDYRGTKDLFGRAFVAEQANLVDGLAAGAVCAMGEGAESTPLCLIEDVPQLSFGGEEAEGRYGSLVVPLAEDIFAPFLAHAPWRKGKRGNGEKST